MNEAENYKKALKEGEEIIKNLTKAVITARDSVPPSMSTIMNEFKNDLRDIKESQVTHIKNELEHWETMKPVVDAFNEKQGFWKTLGVLAKYVGLGTAIIVGLKMTGGALLGLIASK